MRSAAIGAVWGAISVAAGAFGTHALSGKIPDARLETWQTAVLYGMVHAVALVVVGHLRTGHRWTEWLFTVGLFVFVPVLMALALGGPRWFGAVAPLGGAAFIAGWLSWALALVRADAVGIDLRKDVHGVRRSIEVDPRPE